MQAARLPTSLSNKVIPSAKVATLAPSSTLTAVSTSATDPYALDLVADGAAASTVSDTPSLRTQLRRGAPGNATATSRPPTTIRETTTVYIEPDSCTGTPGPTSSMARNSAPTSGAGQRGGIAGGTVGAVLLVAVLTVFCYRRARRGVRGRGAQGFTSLSDLSSASGAAERGMSAHGGLFGSENRTASAAESLATDAPRTPEPAVVKPAHEDRTSEQVPICFRPSHRLISRYSGFPVTPTASTRPSDYLSPVIRDTVLLPRPLRRAGGMRTTLAARSRSWQAGPRRQPAGGGGSGSGNGNGNGGRRATATSSSSSSSSVYSSDATFDFAEYVTIDARTSRGTAQQRASRATDGSGPLCSRLASFPRPPPCTLSGGDGRGPGTSWRESFVFSTPEDDVLLAFPKLARQIEDELA